MANTSEKKNETKLQKLVLLDAHAILHRAYHALPDFVSSKGEPTGGLYGLVTMLIKIIGDIRPDYIVACYDLPQPTHRHEVYKEYKAGRKKADDELVSQMKRSRDIFEVLSIPIYDKAGFEADDMLGTIVEQMKDDKGLQIIIASGDMDTLQLVSDDKVVVYTLKKGIKDTIVYNEKAVNERFGFGPKLLPDYKGLRGDPSDNIIGISGIGEKTATELIKNFGTIEEMYKKLKKNKEAFLEAGIKPRIVELLEKGEEEALFSKTLALIRRDAPIEFKMPEKHWKDLLDVDKAERLFTELEFRTLTARLRQVLFNEAPAAAAEEAASGDVVAQGLVSPDEFRKVAVALWVLDSNITSPTTDDIFAFSKTKDWNAAKEIIFAEIEKRNLKRVYAEIEVPLIPVIDKMHEVGVKIDVNYLKGLSVEYHKKLDNLEKEIHTLAGMEFNVASPKQLGEVLFDKLGLKVGRKTAGGARSTKESELMKLKEVHPIIGFVLDHRELSKLVGTYIDTLPTQADKEGRVHTTFIQTGSTTGRMASTEPALQNIPIKTESGKRIREAFVAAEGYKLVALDYSQIEIRIAAFLSKDETLIDIFRKGEDVHSAVASVVFNVPKEEVTSNMRRFAKVINFGVMYGMGVVALRQNLSEGGQKVSRDEAQKFYNEYFEKFRGLAGYLDKVKAEVSRLGYSETYFGRRRYFEGINSKIPYIKAMAERMAINAPIQGTGADVVKIAMIKIDKWISDNKLEKDVRMLLQVHDELVFEVNEERALELSKKIKALMEEVIDPKEIEGVKLVAEYHIGKSWGELK